jgi:hypothetical protein
VPEAAASSRPGLSFHAPVNDPLTCPNSSLSNRDSDSAAHGTAANGPSRRRLSEWMARASTFLPVPLSPRSSTAASEAAAGSAVSSARCMAGLRDSRRGE